ncbi:MAG: nucleoside deaminase [Burkholderiales bacterium]
MNDHSTYMRHALRLAQQAFDRGDWPVASVLVRDNSIIGEGQNRQTTQTDITIHAETDALRDAFKRTGTTDLRGATLYSTMEPCPMCAWAMQSAGVKSLVLGARFADLQSTDLGDYTIETFGTMIRAPFNLTQGVLRDECIAIRKTWGKDQVKK